MTKTALIKRVEDSKLPDNFNLIEIREVTFDKVLKKAKAKLISALSIKVLKETINKEGFQMHHIANNLKDIKKALEKKEPVIYYTRAKK